MSIEHGGSDSELNDSRPGEIEDLSVGEEAQEELLQLRIDFIENMQARMFRNVRRPKDIPQFARRTQN